jgi:hypothetical protein
VVGIISISGNFTGNASFKNEIGSSFLTCCNFRPSVILEESIEDGTHRNSVPEVLSQKDASHIGIPGHFSGLWYNITPLRPNFGSLCAPELFKEKIARSRIIT